MEGNSLTIEWYLARDGQQHGPLTEAEMRKFVELGHLRETDLVWRAGFAEWRPSIEVFPRPEPDPLPGRPSMAQASQGSRYRQGEGSAGRPLATLSRGRRGRERDSEAEPQPEIDFRPDEIGISERTRTERSRGRKRSGAVRAVAVLLLLCAIAAGGWLVWENQDRFGPIANIGSLVATASNNPSDAAMRVSPFVISGTGADAVEPSLQRTAVWRIAKREFPEWYRARTEQLKRAVGDGADEKTVARLLAESVVALRREHATSALSAPLAALRKVATAFLDNLNELSKLGNQHCYGFISFGEGTPLVVELSRTPAHAEHLQRQMVAVLEAVVEGRRTATRYPQALRADYDMLSWELAKRNWTREDLVTFSDPKRLAALPPEGICKMVQDWFSAHLDVIDSDVQARLLSHSLRPLVEG